MALLLRLPSKDLNDLRHLEHSNQWSAKPRPPFCICSLRFADFSFFGIWFSVFEEVTSDFSVLLSDMVFGLCYFVLFAVFGFARIFMRFWIIISSVL